MSLNLDEEQPVDLPDGASDESLDSSQARDAPERGTSTSPERVFNICGLYEFRLHEGQVVITSLLPKFFRLAFTNYNLVDLDTSTLPLTWDDKYYPDNEIIYASGQKPFHTACF
ncbi:hypothetical protein FMEXI_8080 [Fusarium mexicanum]|uniref:Uncharacterized protein n=1 Tax=Fusarium mexicanum TaxID=751941 RepID=A0A8H5MTV2_9HYPO|nr:hypothetical protein FMEXI_8080 [Fusarium mexicanum]